MKKLNTLAIAAAVLAVAGKAHAMASGSVVLDPTNLVQNTVTAARSVEQVANQIRQYQTQLAQYRQMVQDIRGLNVAALLQYASPEAAAQIRTLERARDDLLSVRQSLTDVTSRVAERRVAANRARMSVGQYYEYLKTLREAGNRVAMASIKKDEEVLRASQARMKQIQSWDANTASLVNNASGAHQQMSAQLNVIAATMNQMVEMTARKSAVAEAKEAEAATAAEDEAAAARRDRQAVQDGADGRRRSLVESLKR